LDIVSGTPTYSLPVDVLSIRRVTWKGKKIDPLIAREWRYINDITSTSEPQWYVFNQVGRNTIRLYPIPNETIIANQTSLFSTNIATQCIVEYYQLTDSAIVLLPAYIRRRLIKYYVMHVCFAQEGKGQNLKSSARMKKRFDFYMNWFRKMHADHYIVNRYRLSGDKQRNVLARPV